MSVIQLFYFKTLSDRNGNEYVVLSGCASDSANDIEDRTAFEAVENHVHVLDNIKKRDMEHVDFIGEKLGRLLLDRLKLCFPQKKFYVFVTYELHESLTVRFHQD